MISEYDKIRLKSGLIGRVLEIIDKESYIAEVFTKDGDVDTTEITNADIASVFEEVERTFTEAL